MLTRLSLVEASVLADLGKRGCAIRLDHVPSRKVDGVARALVVTANPHVKPVEIARTLRELADLVEAGEG
jgi:hypothetical protein